MLVQARAIWPKKPRSVRSCRRKGDSPHSGQNRAEIAVPRFTYLFTFSIVFLAPKPMIPWSSRLFSIAAQSTVESKPTRIDPKCKYGGRVQKAGTNGMPDSARTQHFKSPPEFFLRRQSLSSSKIASCQS